MCVNMPKNIIEERLRWVRMVEESNLKLKEVIELFPHSGRTLKRWLKAFREYGEEGLIPKSTAPKTQPNETPIRTKERIIELRNETRLCAKKLHWKLEKQGLVVPVSTIGKILKKEGLVKKYRSRKIKYKYIKVQLQPGELVEIDVKYVPGRVAGRRYYQYTAICCSSRWRYLKIFDQQTNNHSVEFLKEVIEKFPYDIKAIKTDNGSIFTNYYTSLNKRSDLMIIKTLHSLDLFCKERNIVHYLIDPGKPAQNGKVERSHRSDQESFYDRNKFRNVADLKKKILVWNNYYNNLEHCGLNGKTPNEMLGLRVT
ncbi:IS481 family transposase [Thermodesulfobacteriota bacterium]